MVGSWPAEVLASELTWDPRKAGHPTVRSLLHRGPKSTGRSRLPQQVILAFCQRVPVRLVGRAHQPRARHSGSEGRSAPRVESSPCRKGTVGTWAMRTSVVGSICG